MATATAARTTELSYEAYDALPPIDGRYDIVDGELIMSPAPEVVHQWLLVNLLYELRSFARDHNQGEVLCAPCDVVISQRPLRVRQPDVMFFSRAHWSARRRRDVKGMKRFHFAPDLVIEILSTTERSGMVAAKLDDYRTIGVRQVWLVEPDADLVTVLRLHAEGDVTLGAFASGDRLHSEVLPELDLPVEAVFA